MSIRLMIIALLASVSIFISVIHLIRKDRLSEEYSSVWLVVSVLIITSSLLSEKILQGYAWFKGDDGSGAEILLFFSVTFLVFFLIYMSVKLSDFRKNIVKLSQEIALLRNKTDQ